MRVSPFPRSWEPREFQHAGQLRRIELENIGDLFNRMVILDALQDVRQRRQRSAKNPEPPVFARQDLYLGALRPIELGCMLEPVLWLRLRGFAGLAGGWRRVGEVLFPSRKGSECGLAKGHSPTGGEGFQAASLVVGELYLEQVFCSSGHIEQPSKNLEVSPFKIMGLREIFLQIIQS